MVISCHRQSEKSDFDREEDEMNPTINLIALNSEIKCKKGGDIDISVHMVHAHMNDEEINGLKKLTEEFSEKVNEFVNGNEMDSDNK